MADEEFLPGLPMALVRAAYAAAPGNELASGKFKSPESSACLVANCFGYFLDKPQWLPPVLGCETHSWPATAIFLEAEAMFPWRGGRRPWLDVLVETGNSIIGIESKRYEPFRPKSQAEISDAYLRKDAWGPDMNGYQRILDGLRSTSLSFRSLDAAQLIKHALGLRTMATRKNEYSGKRAVLFYLFSEPDTWPDGRAISDSAKSTHRSEIEKFGQLTVDDEVAFLAYSYRDLLSAWKRSERAEVRAHAMLVEHRFHVTGANNSG